MRKQKPNAKVDRPSLVAVKVKVKDKVEKPKLVKRSRKIKMQGARYEKIK